MHRHNGLRTRCDRILYLVDINREGAWIDVHKHRTSPGVEDSCDSRDECERNRDYLVGGTDACRQQRQMECARTRVQADCVFCPTIIGEFLLESLDFSA